MMQRSYPATAFGQDAILISVGTRDRLRALGYGSYDAAIQALLAGRKEPAGVGYDGIARAAPDVAERPASRPKGLCPAFTPSPIRGLRRPCRVRGPHEEHRYWSPSDTEVRWR